jgi:flavin reductase
MDVVEAEVERELVHRLMTASDEAKRTYRDAMAAMAGAVSVITTMDSGEPTGFAATAVCSVTDEPPTLLVCVNHEASVYAAFSRADRLCVNVLSAEQVHVAKRFGGKIPQGERFEGSRWTTLFSGSPVLAEAAVAFDCTVKNRVSVGTHDVMFCQVEYVRHQANPSALVYFARGYHEID